MVFSRTLAAPLAIIVPCLLIKCDFNIMATYNKATKRKGEEAEGNQGKKPALGHWANGLISAMEDPNLRVFADNRIVVIKDKYPKARHHLLVLPMEPISNLKVITRDHIDLLEHIQKVGTEICEQEEYRSIKFRMGFHAEPSMNRLHMHIISDDFCSDYLKTKKHYNSFITDHFIDSKKLIESVKKIGKANIPSNLECQRMLQKPLACHKCGEQIQNMPKLKQHLGHHEKLNE